MHRFSVILVSALFGLALLGSANATTKSLTLAKGTKGKATLSGVVAAGRPVDGLVEAVNADGVVSAAVATDPANGHYRLVVEGPGPFLIRAKSRSGKRTFYSYAWSEGRANIHPLTRLSLYAALGRRPLAPMWRQWGSIERPDRDQVYAGAAVISANLAKAMERHGIDFRRYDFFTADFATDGTGFDGLLDQLDIQFADGYVKVRDRFKEGVLELDWRIDTAPVDYDRSDNQGRGGAGGRLPQEEAGAGELTGGAYHGSSENDNTGSNPSGPIPAPYAPTLDIMADPFGSGLGVESQRCGQSGHGIMYKLWENLHSTAQKERWIKAT